MPYFEKFYWELNIFLIRKDINDNYQHFLLNQKMKEQKLFGRKVDIQQAVKACRYLSIFIYVIRYPGPRNAFKIQKFRNCQTRFSSFSKTEIKKLYRKNHTIINSSEYVSREDNISRVIYCRGVRADNMLTFSGLNWWYCITSFHSDQFSELTYSFFIFIFL